MRTALVITADPAEWLICLLGRLQPWAVASGILFGVSGAPAMDTLGLVSFPGYVAQLAVEDGGAQLCEFSLSSDERIAIYRRAENEAGSAQAILRCLREHLGLPEVTAYLDAIDEVLEPAPDMRNLVQTQAFILGLHVARNRLLEDTGCLHLWLKVAQVLSPGVEDHLVPERFVRRTLKDPTEEPLAFNRGSIGARRLVRNFLGEDADRSARAS